MADQAAPATAQPGQDPAQEQGAQPSQGQGGNELHEQFISSVPEQDREVARRLAPLWDKTIQGKFTEHSDYRKQWEPFESIDGLRDQDPENLTQLIELDRMFRDDPEAFQKWHSEIGKQFETGESEEQSDEFDQYSDEYEDPRLKQLIEANQKHEERWQKMEQQQQQAEEQRKMERGQEIVRQELDAIKKEFPQMTEEDERAIYRFASAYDSRDAIQKGYADYKNLVSRAEKGMFEQKVQDPAPAESGGRPDTQAPPVTSFEDANRLARERMRQ